MSARGVDCLEVWIDNYVQRQRGDQMLAEEFAERLVADAAANGLTVADMNLEGYSIAKITAAANRKPRSGPGPSPF